MDLDEAEDKALIPTGEQMSYRSLVWRRVLAVALMFSILAFGIVSKLLIKDLMA